MKIIVTIPDGELSEAVRAWRDGGSYTIDVVQDSVGEFSATDAMEAEPAPVEPVVPGEEAAVEPSATATVNPAIANVIARGRTKAPKSPEEETV